MKWYYWVAIAVVILIIVVLIVRSQTIKSAKTQIASNNATTNPTSNWNPFQITPIS